MERQANSSQTLCRGGCGYYGSSATDGLCSVCFREVLKKKQHQPSNAATETRTLRTLTVESESYEKTPLLAQGDQAAYCDPEKTENTKRKIRCLTCHKKLGLTGFECRCGGMFCSIHRYSDEHRCTFDYRSLGAQEIRKNNPVVAGERIKKI